MTQLSLASAFLESGALFDDTKTYRYQLVRRWAPGALVLWIMLNPSTADEIDLDPTLTRVLGFTRRWGCFEDYGGFEIGNVYGYRSPYPEDLWAPACKDPVGPDNLHHIEAMARRAALVMVGWGKHAKPEHVRDVCDVLARVGRTPHCLAINQDGSPSHPLYLKSTLTPIPWPP